MSPPASEAPALHVVETVAVKNEANERDINRIFDELHDIRLTQAEHTKMLLDISAAIASLLEPRP